MIRSARVAIVACCLALPAAAEQLPIPEDYRMAVSSASQRGIAIFLHDAAAARASDELMERKVFERDERLEGWLTDLVADRSAVIVDFIGKENGKPAVLYRVQVPVGDAQLRFEALKPAAPLSESQQARWRARQLATEEIGKRKDLCSAQYNSVVISPDPAPDGLIHVYMLAATAEAGAVVAGGHFRYDFSPDGKHLESQRAFTKSCFKIDAPDEKKGKPVAFMLTHLLDPTPTEIHVFLSRLHGQAIYVMTEAGNWLVNGAEIQFLERREK